jgi:hypothetical protein
VMLKACSVSLLVIALFVGSLVLFSQCNSRSTNADKTSGMLEQCQHDFDILLDKCYGGANGNG